MLETAQLTNLLREKGFKVTPQRLAVYEVLKRTRRHPDADSIYNELQPYYPTMSLATVYKSLDILSEIGVVQTLHLGEERFRYDARTQSHPHIRCQCCGKVEDLLDIDDSQLVEAVRKKTSYKLLERQIYFYGICQDCQKKMPKLH